MNPIVYTAYKNDRITYIQYNSKIINSFKLLTETSTSVLYLILNRVVTFFFSRVTSYLTSELCFKFLFSSFTTPLYSTDESYNLGIQNIIPIFVFRK